MIAARLDFFDVAFQLEAVVRIIENISQCCNTVKTQSPHRRIRSFTNGVFPYIHIQPDIV